MPTPPSPRAVNRRLVENSRASIRIRLAALDRLKKQGVPCALMERLLRDKATPARIVAVLAELYEARRAVQTWKRQRGKSTGGSVLGTK